MRTPAKPPLVEALPHEVALAILTDALARIRFGEVRLSVHQGRVVQIEVTEKTRFDQR